MTVNHFKKYYPIVLLILVIIVSTVLLSRAERINRAVLESRQDSATLELMQQIFPKAAFYSYTVKSDIYTMYDISRQNIGYTFYGADWGYRGMIKVLVGLKDTETIKNIVVISQTEDISYWNRLINKNYFDQFINLKIEDCYAVYEWQSFGIDAVTGATYSSRGVANAVREAALVKIEYLD